MTSLDHALRLARLGFPVFPLVGDSKLPLIEDFPNRATRNETTLGQWFWDPVLSWPQPYNVGISTTRFGVDEALIALDVDDKNGKNGSQELLKLEMRGLELPPTYEQTTPTGGRHIVYRAPVAVRGGVDRLAPGLDVKSHGGYIVASGSTIGGKAYTDNGQPVAEAPQWLIDRCGAPIIRDPAALSSAPPADVDQDAARERVIAYLSNEAQESVKGQGGDATAYKVACRVRDFGVSEQDALDLMMEHWFEGSGWSHDRLGEKVAHAYRYAKHAAGSAAPEAQFEALAQREPQAADRYHSTHPVNKLNNDFAFVIIGGNHFVLWETRDADGKHLLKYLDENTFHARHAGELTKHNRVKKDGDTETVVMPVTKVWMGLPASARPPEETTALWRRSYDGVCFKPEQPTPPGFYNVWRGFAYDPLPRDETPQAGHRWALDAWIEHVEKNCCRGDADLARWLTGYFAHIVQRPWEKPLVAPVFRGSKGVGKNSVVERVAALLGSHALVTHERRYMLSNFNGHMEQLLLFGLDEAIWAGDKQGEGVLKGLITGTKHFIERKNKEPYPVDNLTRVIIFGNEDWLVPASHDERRYAVLDVGDGRKKDKPFFERMRKEMEAGGYRLLLRYLLDFDLRGVDVNEAPVTEALLEQKLHSLEPVEQWWSSCLQEGALIGSEFSTSWPEEIQPDAVLGALNRYYQLHRIHARVPSPSALGKRWNKCAPGVKHVRVRRDNKQSYVYRLPDIEQARKEWAAYLGHTIKWD